MFAMHCNIYKPQLKQMCVNM